MFHNYNNIYIYIHNNVSLSSLFLTFSTYLSKLVVSHTIVYKTDNETDPANIAVHNPLIP